jgi:hypothetical protein
LTTGYSQLSPDVADILLDMVKFSDSLHTFGPDIHNVGNIALALSAVSMNTIFRGFKKRIEIAFENPIDLTEFRVYIQSSTEGSKDMVYLCTGKTSINCVVPNVMTINTIGWSGAAVAPSGSHIDHIIIITNSHVSIDQAERLINDIDCEIDQFLRKRSLIVTPEGSTFPADLYFVVNPPVPRQIKIASAHLAAFRILNNVFKASRSIMQTGSNTQPEREEQDKNDFYLAYQWQKVAINALKEYIETINVLGGNAPRWSAVEPMQESIGIQGQLPAVGDNGVRHQDADGNYDGYDAGVDTFRQLESLLNP